MLIRSLAFAIGLIFLAGSSAFAQWGLDVPAAPPMDMSGLIQRQVGLQAWGDQMAYRVAQKYYEDVQAFRRATGYTGPLPAPVSPQQLQRSVQALQQQYDRNNAHWRDTSDRTSAAIERYIQGAIRGQTYLGSPVGGSSLPSGYPSAPYAPVRYPW